MLGEPSCLAIMAVSAMTMRPIDRSNPLPLNLQLRALLEDGIRFGKWPVGSMLPSIRDLIEEHQVSLPVVRMALDSLSEAGIIRTEHGRGSTVLLMPTNNQAMRKILFLLCNRARLDPFFSRILSGAERAATAAGCMLVFRQVEPDHTGGAAHHLREMSVDGVVCSGDVDDASYHALVDCRLPFAIAGGLYRQQPPNAEVRIIGNDNYQGGRMATAHLIQAGHRAIALVTGPLEGRHWRQRQLGYEAAMRDANINIDSSLQAIVAVDDSDIAEPIVSALLVSNPHCTALFAGNDRYALAAYRALRKLGRQPGRDVSIVGYDDLDFAELLEPPLTTIQPNIEGIGEGAVGLLLEAFEGKPPRQLLRRVHLIERGSVFTRGN